MGDFVLNKLITVGYEDYNYYLATSESVYCVKIFNHARTREDIDNYLKRLRAIAESKVNAPAILSVGGDICFSLDYENNHYDICVFECINGKSFFELGRKPNSDEIREIARQTALINNLQIKPNFIYDEWAVSNFKQEYERKREYLSDEYKAKFDKLSVELNGIDFDKLPKAFVHGDIINTNVMKDDESKIWILDFSVSNYLPRITDLAVISCNLCLDEKSKQRTYANIKLLLDEYGKYNQLTDYEFAVFNVFYKLANAMHILQTGYLIKAGEESEENKYWLREGIIGYSYSEGMKSELFYQC